MSLSEGRWGSGADALAKAFVTAFNDPEHDQLHLSTCLVLIDTTREIPFQDFRSLVYRAVDAAGGKEQHKSNIVVAHADTSDPAVSVARLLAAADLVVMPSRDGVVGLVVMQAMASGKAGAHNGGVMLMGSDGNGIAMGSSIRVDHQHANWCAYQLQADNYGATIANSTSAHVNMQKGIPQEIATSDERAGLYVGAPICEPDVAALAALLRDARRDPQRVRFTIFVQH